MLHKQIRLGMLPGPCLSKQSAQSQHQRVHRDSGSHLPAWGWAWGGASRSGVQEVECKSFGFHGSPGCHSPESRLVGSCGSAEMEPARSLGGLQLWERASPCSPTL